MNTLAYILIILSLVISAFFSGMRIAFISSNKFRHELNKKTQSLSSKILDIFYRNPYQFVSTLQTGNLIALIVFSLQIAFLTEPYLTHFITDDGLIILVLSIISTILILLVGEFIPGIIFRLNPDFSLNIFAIPLYICYILLYPITKIFSLLSFGILKLTGVKNLKIFSDQTPGKADLDTFLQQNIEDGQRPDIETEVKIFKNALDFSNVRLRDCIVPRTEIIACDTEATIDELKSKFIETGLSKVVIYNESIDDIIGYLHSSELFKNPDDWTQYIQSVSIVPETMPANKLMRFLMQEKKSLAVVVDEFGGTAGIVTLEDIVEEIFGEIEDEYDTKSHTAKQIAENEFLLSGRLEIDILNETFGLDLPESDDYVTVAGYILHEYKNFPKVNENIVIGKYTFKIIKMSATKIELVRMKVGE